MALFEYACPKCGRFESMVRADTQPCQMCGGEAKRVWSWTTGVVLHEHFNPAFGQNVRSREHARELAKIASADQSERLGMDINYELTYAHDYKEAGIDKAEKEHYAARTAEHKAAQR